MFFRIKQLFIFLWESKSKYRIHSPFVFTYITKVIGGNWPSEKGENQLINLKKELNNDTSIIELVDFGAKGGPEGKIRNVPVKTLFNQTVSSLFKLKIIVKTAKYAGAEQFLECGTSLGYSSSFFALHFSKFIGIEGALSLSEITKMNISKLGGEGEVINGKIEDHLAETLSRNDIEKLAIFLDGNHTKNGLLTQFKTILLFKNKIKLVIVDDIRWSKDMWEAWNEIIENKFVVLSLDLFQLGIIIFNYDLKKQSFTLLNKKLLKLMA